MKAAYTQEVLRSAQRLASLEKAGHALSTPDPRREWRGLLVAALAASVTLYPAASAALTLVR